MSRKAILSVAIIILAFAAIGGATMAWFTDSEELTNTFTAGTLTIDGSDYWKGYEPGDIWDNVNPGDCKDKVFKITNTGSKYVLIRFSMSGDWLDMVDGDPDLVTITAPDGWESKVDGQGVTWWYLNEKIAPEGFFEFELKVCIDGAGTGNEYQGKSFKLDFDFEAIQASNNASGDLWGVDSLYNPADEMTALNWIGFDLP